MQNATQCLSTFECAVHIILSKQIGTEVRELVNPLISHTKHIGPNSVELTRKTEIEGDISNIFFLQIFPLTPSHFVTKQKGRA